MTLAAPPLACTYLATTRRSCWPTQVQQDTHCHSLHTTRAQQESLWLTAIDQQDDTPSQAGYPKSTTCWNSDQLALTLTSASPEPTVGKNVRTLLRLLLHTATATAVLLHF